MTTPEAAALRHHEPAIRQSGDEPEIECECGDQRGAETFIDHLVRVLTPLAPEVPPRRFARGLVNTPADQIEVLRGALDLVARRLHEFHTGLERFDDCERDTCRYARRALGTAALSLPIQTGATGTPPDSGDGAAPIDAETLAKAMRQCDGVSWPARWFEAEHNFDWVARQVAAEYARLRSGSPAPEGGE